MGLDSVVVRLLVLLTDQPALLESQACDSAFIKAWQLCKCCTPSLTMCGQRILFSICDYKCKSNFLF